MQNSIKLLTIYCFFYLQTCNQWYINASPPSSVFNDSNATIDHLLTIMSTFSDVVIATYKRSMPDVAALIQDDVNELLDNIWLSTDNKRAVNSTRVRYDEFIRDSQKSIDSSIKIIRTSFDDVKETLGETSVKLFETATSLETGLRDKGCTEAEIFEFFSPYMNRSVECVQTAIMEEDHFRSNAETVGEAVQSVLRGVVTTLKLCTNKGSRVVFCAQRNSLGLSSRFSEIRRLTERQFSRVEKQNLQQSFQKGKVCLKDILDEGEKSVEDIKCEKSSEDETPLDTLSKDIQLIRKMIGVDDILDDQSDVEHVLEEELMEYFDD